MILLLYINTVYNNTFLSLTIHIQDLNLTNSTTYVLVYIFYLRGGYNLSIIIFTQQGQFLFPFEKLFFASKVFLGFYFWGDILSLDLLEKHIDKAQNMSILIN